MGYGDIISDFSGEKSENNDGTKIKANILSEDNNLLKFSEKYLLKQLGQFTSDDGILQDYEGFYIKSQLEYHKKLKNMYDVFQKTKGCITNKSREELQHNFEIFQSQFLSNTHLTTLRSELENADINNIKNNDNKQNNITIPNNKKKSPKFSRDRYFVQSGKKIDKNDQLFNSEVIDFIISLEGFIAISKWDHGQYSWGYSTKAPEGGLKITKEKAMSELSKKVNEILISLNKEPWFKGMNQNQKISLVSFFYNVGLTKKGKENLMYRLKNGYYKAATNMMLQYKFAGGSHSKGLQKRRIKEVKKFWS